MRRSGTAGFTLVELMVTIAVAAILLTIALPSFKSTLESNRVATATNEILGAVALARAEAIRNVRGSGMCNTTVGGNACSDDADWQELIVWVESGAAAGYQATGGAGAVDTLVRRVQLRPDLDFNLAQAGDTTHHVLFNSRGLVANGAGSWEVVIKPKDCRAGEQLQRKLILNHVGQARVEKEQCA